MFIQTETTPEIRHLNANSNSCSPKTTMKTINIKVKLDPGATMPTRAHDADVGYDVTGMQLTLIARDGSRHIVTTEEQLNNVIEILYRHYSFPLIEVDTGVHVQPEHDYYVELVPNSRQSKRSVRWNNSIGIIDPSYTGSIKIYIHDKVDNEDLAEYLPGKVVGQLIVRKKHDAIFEQVDSLDETDRGNGGFGSTANN